MKITLLCSSEQHPVNVYLKRWMESCGDDRQVDLVRSRSELTHGDFLFLISCSELVTEKDRSSYTHSLVLHASDLPKGRGWSPHIWDIVNGADHITLSLLEAEGKVDSGRIWAKRRIAIPKNILWDEINHLLFTAEIELLEDAVLNRDKIIPVAQSDEAEVSYHRKRTAEDSKIDPHSSIAEQFDLIRASDPNRFPAYFNHLGRTYVLRIEVSDE